VVVVVMVRCDAQRTLEIMGITTHYCTVDDYGMLDRRAMEIAKQGSGHGVRLSAG